MKGLSIFRIYIPCIAATKFFSSFFKLIKNLSLLYMKAILTLAFTIILLHCNYLIAAQACSLTCPENIIAKADSGKGGTNVSFPAATVSATCGAVSYTPASGSFFQIGSSSVIATTATGERCSFTVTVTDNEPPALSPIVLSSKRIWPANGRMKEVAVRYLTTDNANESNCAVSVSSNDPSGQDAEVVDAHLVRLRASRLPNGMPRTYTITVTCTDAAGNISKRTTGISVAKNVTKKIKG